MEQTLWNTLLQQGPFAALFVWLLFYVMKTSKEREMRLQELLNKFSDKYDVVITELREVNSELREVKEKVGK
ncbi:hypothetical protein LOK74_18930 [Brevibacillus humidisoli]|uniref:BhlA/UviB family holin-like peptide n=1 Tax=Brevibacillus humidisoli TaxID=2895522 RepID=UPI001E5C0E72|nr:BhlA/UviB family holin-like peptide [Brevibacillus humidisoli]UFJ40088.1 hypothetical protein LOK74_18930 [Brevibacillus humidisoli]